MKVLPGYGGLKWMTPRNGRHTTEFHPHGLNVTATTLVSSKDSTQFTHLKTENLKYSFSNPSK